MEAVLLLLQALMSSHTSPPATCMLFSDREGEVVKKTGRVLQRALIPVWEHLHKDKALKALSWHTFLLSQHNCMASTS